MTTIAKVDAIAALRACADDVSHVGLRRAGLPCRLTSVLGRVLDDLGCTTKAGQGNLRTLIVSLDEAIECLHSLPGDEIEEPEPHQEEEESPPYTVIHDPHRIYYAGELINAFDLSHMVRLSRSRYPDINGLEVSDRQLTYRIYRGLIYRLDDGEMTETQL